jgi:hypothetical protein
MVIYDARHQQWRNDRNSFGRQHSQGNHGDQDSVGAEQGAQFPPGRALGLGW